MRNVKFLCASFIIIIMLFQVNTQIFPIIPVYPYCINGTLYIVDLQDYKDEYLYFSDDFYDSCNDEKDEVKPYELTSEVENLINSKNLLNFAMLESNKTSYSVKIEEIKDLDWKPINQYSESPANRWTYEIKKEGKKNIVLFRLAKNGNEKGSLSMQTLPYQSPSVDMTYITDTTDKTDRIDKTDMTDKDDNREKDSVTESKIEEDIDTDKIIRINSSNHLTKINFILLILLILF